MNTTSGTPTRSVLTASGPYTEQEAKADAAKRNAYAEALGIKTRYEVAPLGS